MTVRQSIVSVVIPCYRQARFLPGALECVFSQTYPSIESIVVDDGSDDDTAAVVKNYGERVRYIYKANGGPSSARNVGIRAATGDYLLFLDGDDLLHAEAVARGLQTIDGQPRRIAVLGHRRFETTPEESTGKEVLLTNVHFVPRLLLGNPAPIHSYLVPRQAVADVGLFEESFKWCEDWDYWLRLAMAGYEFVGVPLVAAYYRRYPGSWSSNSVGMLETRALMLLAAHRKIVSSEALYRLWGDALVEAMEGCYRYCVVGGARSRIASDVWTAMRALGRRRNGAAGSWKKKMTRRLLGQLGERLILNYFRFFEPAVYERYRTP